MSPWLFAKLVQSNLPHLIGILIYGFIAIALAFLCYKLFCKIIPLNIGLDSSPQDRLTAVILAVGIVIGVSFLVAVTAYEPAKISSPDNNTTSSSASSSGCGSSKPKAVPAKNIASPSKGRPQQPAVIPLEKPGK